MKFDTITKLSNAVARSIRAEDGYGETTDGGDTWADITGDLPVRGPSCRRYTPRTHDL